MRVLAPDAWQEVYDLADETWRFPALADGDWIRRLVHGDWERIALIEQGASEPRVLLGA